MVNENQLVPYVASALPVATGPWLVLAPHADDESFGMGGTLAKAVKAGIEVHLVVMTNGALGGSDDNLIAVREAEARKAANLLGLREPVFLGYPDRGLRVDGETVAQLHGAIARVAPAAVFFPGCFELHPDHRAAAAIAWQALGKFPDRQIVPVSYEVLVQSPVNVLVDITPVLTEKDSAMRVYESQLAEHRYITIATALNRLRALTLRGDISHAEGFYCFAPEAVDRDFEGVMMAALGVYFRV